MPRSSDVLCAIPARYQSSRFPGKPLTMIAGTPMIVRVAEAAKQATSWVVVATDDDRIISTCKQHGIDAERSGSHHPTGTDRVAEVAARLEAEYIVNLQGDEPLIPPMHLTRFLAHCQASTLDVCNAMSPLLPSVDVADVTIPKVVVGLEGRLVYISRSVVPNAIKSSVKPTYHRQIGLYGFTADALATFGGLSRRGETEQYEDIEILRFLDLGIGVSMMTLEDYGPAVDLPEHVALIEKHLNSRRT